MHEQFIPITLFLVVGAVIIASFVLQYHRRRLESLEIVAAIEKGVEVKFPERKRNRLLPGLIWTLMGIVMTLAMAMVIPDDAPSGMWIWGLAPVAVGVAYLTVYKLEDSKDEPSDS